MKFNFEQPSVNSSEGEKCRHGENPANCIGCQFDRLTKVESEDVEVESEKTIENKEGEPLSREDLAVMYAHSFAGGALVKYENYSIKDLERLISDPDRHGKGFGMDQEQVANLRDWVVEAQAEAVYKQKRFKEMHADNPENALFKKGFENVPEGFVSVFHFTGKASLDGLAKDGLRPSAEIYEKLSEEVKERVNTERLEFDKRFNDAAPEGYSRVEAVYAYADYRSGGGMGNGGLVIEIKVDPTKVLVTDGEYFTEARVSQDSFGDTGKWEETYWEKAITLAEYNALSDSERLSRFHFPEVIIPNGVSPEKMRAHSLQNVR